MAGVIINLETELGKEIMKWEQFPRHAADGTIHAPGNPYTFRPYPKMLYKAQLWRDGKMRTSAPAPDPFAFTDPLQFQNAELAVERFNTSCQRVVPDESAHLIAKGQGWYDHPEKAVEGYERERRATAQAAAEAEYQAARMSEKAQAEWRAAVDSTEEHVSDIPAPKKRGPRKKIAVPAEG